MTTPTREHVTRQLWVEWRLIPEGFTYGTTETVYGTIPKHLAARQWPGQDVSEYEVRPDDSYSTGRTDKPDGRWTWTLTGELVVSGVPGPIAAVNGAIAAVIDQSPRAIAARLSCPVCRGPVPRQPGHRQRVYCSPVCKREQERIARTG